MRTLMKINANPVGVGVLGECRKVLDGAVGVGILQQHAGELPGGEVGLEDVALHHLQPQGRRPRLHHARRLRVHFVRHKQLPTLVLPENAHITKVVTYTFF
jgi:hypothetical protein